MAVVLQRQRRQQKSGPGTARRKAYRTLPLLAAASCIQVGSSDLLSATFAEHVCQGEDQEFGKCAPQPPCKECTAIDCVFSDWGPWYDSGGCVGLMFRHRAVKVANNECGTPCVGSKIESIKHEKAECAAEVRDCVFEPWSSWSTCASIMDQAIRSRGVLHQPTVDGTPCKGNLRQTRPCGGPQRQDCQFSAWREWTQCSASCGEGRHSRMRQVHVEATHGGRTCNDNLLEAKTCMVQECPQQDCELSGWTDWTAPGRGQRERRRNILKAPEGAGLPCEKALMETSAVPGPEIMDCEVTEWTEWSDCTKSCLGGQTYRERALKTPNKHGGKCPLLTLKAMAVCNDHPCENAIMDCLLSAWTDWSECSVSVGKGAMSRVRILERPATAQGEGCSGPLAEVAGCVVRDQDEVDCVWADWEAWSACSETCGGGQKRRGRVVERSAENGGAQCKAEVKSQVAPCNTQECDKGCVDAAWGEWLDWTDCTATCDSGFASRTRTLLVQANRCGKPVSGLREDFHVCPQLPPCIEDRDCVLSEWEDWAHCSCSCSGVRERNRHIAVYSAANGTACLTRALKAIEPCNPGVADIAPAECGGEEPQDCSISLWTEWSKCTAPCGGGQQSRKRELLAASKGGGKPCEDSLMVTAPCNTQPCEAVVCQDCQWEEWSDWSECTECGGQHTRHRSVLELPNSCGKPCDMRSTMEVSTCTSVCEETSFCGWTEWTDPKCSGRCGQSTTMRSRELVLSQDASVDFLFKAASDAQCRGTQLEAVPCEQAPDCALTCSPRNCAFGDWGEWAAATCVGLCERQRIITTMNNECGLPCNGELLATKPCPALCDESEDCVLSSWSQWTDCDATQQGQRFRQRRVLQEPKYEGVACNAPLNETRACNVPDPVSCRLAAWSRWESCSKSCGIGLHSRSRGVEEEATNGGEQCSGSLQQMQPCSEQDCNEEPLHSCILDQWSEWSGCSADGQRSRDRGIQRPASGGGRPCEGVMHQTDTCSNRAVDCELSAWTSWDECDKTCGMGQTRRDRQISRFPEHGGKLCPDVLLETKGCNLGPCQVMDCVVSGWALWSACSTSCGTGMQSRHREVIRQRGEGGVGCFWELGETRQCEDQLDCGIKDCKLSDWGDWGQCSVSCSGGFRRRLREIEQLPELGGRTCAAEVFEAVEPCGLEDCHKPCYDGHFGAWSTWAPCSVSCEGGSTFRTRRIAKMANECGLEPQGLDREEKFCNEEVPCEEPRDCLFEEWTSWSVCSTSCNGVKRRSRSAQYGRGSGAFCMGPVRQTFPCNPSEGEAAPEECQSAPDVDCILSEWEGWSSCSSSCGGGEHVRSRSIVQHPMNNGRVCGGALSEIRECARNSCGGPAAVDCAYGEWQDWQECTRCDGEHKRVREITAYAANGGRACRNFDSEQVEKCPRECGEPTYCGWSSWVAWSECSTQCGTGGKRHRRRTLEISSGPPNDTEGQGLQMTDVSALGDTMRRYEVLYNETKDLEGSHLQEIAAAFCTGCASLFAGMVVLRGMHVGSRASSRPLSGMASARTAQAMMVPGDPGDVVDAQE